MAVDAEVLIKAARLARRHAYAPYSNYRVGAALGFAGGDVVVGVNVENASYGLSQCAERTALFSAVAEGKSPETISCLVVASAGPVLASPCGACRQVMVELMDPQASVLLVGDEGDAQIRLRVGDLLPSAFSRDAL